MSSYHFVCWQAVSSGESEGCTRVLTAEPPHIGLYLPPTSVFSPSWRANYETCAKEMRCSVKCVRAYLKRYADRCTGGRPPTCEDYSRVHNGGPSTSQSVDRKIINNNNNNNNNIHICIAPYGRNFRGAKRRYKDSATKETSDSMVWFFVEYWQNSIKTVYSYRCILCIQVITFLISLAIWQTFSISRITLRQVSKSVIFPSSWIASSW